MRIFYALSRVFFTLEVVYHPAYIWAGSPSIIQDPQGKGVWAALTSGVQAPGPSFMLREGKLNTFRKEAHYESAFPLYPLSTVLSPSFLP